MANQASELGAIIAELAREKIPGLTERYKSRVLTDEHEVKLARQMATRVFVNLGKISAEDLDEEGILKHDAILSVSTFFGTFDRDNELVATGRLLWGENVDIDDLRMPVDEIDPEEAEFLRSQPAGSIAEIGSLAKLDKSVHTVAVLKALRNMWAFADQNEITIFTCGLEPKVLPRYQAMFGDALTVLSPDTVEFPGIHGPQVPIRIDVRESVARQRATKNSSLPQRIERSIVGPYVTRDSPSVRK